MLSDQHQAITWTIDELLSIGPHNNKQFARSKFESE